MKRAQAAALLIVLILAAVTATYMIKASQEQLRTSWVSPQYREYRKQRQLTDFGAPD